MNQLRKEIILKEIEYWKKNRLLPEQYCNYLLTLYSEGEHEVTSRKNRIGLVFSNIIFLLILVFLLANYFTEMLFHLQMTLNVILLVISIGFTLFFSNKKQFFYKIFMILSFLTLFVTTTEFADFFSSSTSLLFAVIFLNCLVWYLSGKKLKLSYLKIAGIVGVVLVIGTLIRNLFFS